MTGFGAVTSDVMGYRTRLEIKTLNNRYREYFFRVPHFFGAMEETIKKAINQKIARGRIELLLHMEPTKTQNPQEVSINFPAARSLYAELTKLVEDLDLPDPVTLDHLLKEDKFFLALDNLNLDNLDQELLLKELLALLDQVLGQLTHMREVEGKSLETDIREHLKHMNTTLAQLKVIAVNVPTIVTKRYQARLEELAETLVDPDRLAQEAAILGEKLDITEEITRFGTHLQTLKNLLDSKEPVGRRLEFLLQELLREANTMGSKSQSLHITDIVLTFKSELEKIREQVLNIE
jgi:uncharacterized protein (TIGR00255 family)